MTKKEMNTLGWERLDVILVSGDAYIDSPFSGVALIGKSLLAAGYKVGVISQPLTGDDIMQLGVPNLYWGVTAGLTDSLVANYTASGKLRRSCDFTPGGENNKRPDRATIVYTNLIKQHSKEKKPIVLGGIEASLRRLTHYDLLKEKLLRPLLFDSKADFLIYGQGEIPAVMLAKGEPTTSIPNLCYIAKEAPEGAVIYPSYEECIADKDTFGAFFKEFYADSSTLTRNITAQRCGDRFLIQNPAHIMTSAELDKIHEADFERAVHPYDLQKGAVRGAETTKNSISAHRGCFGECSFCAISVHQGRMVTSRSEASIINEAQRLKGTISDVGGATANMYGSECALMKRGTPCKDKSCLYPTPCPTLANSQKRYVELLAKLRGIAGIKKIFIASGIRCDMAIHDKNYGSKFIQDLAKHHTGGQIKLAPEHSDQSVLDYMGKSSMRYFEEFAERFMQISRQEGKKQFITCYFMAAHPGCTMNSMDRLKRYIKAHLGFTPEQVQIFTPTPSTWSTCMYYTGKDKEGKSVYVAKGKERNEQKDI
jgi:uncharacterized radical SAM protein YgiQ